jgi:hypothetical protein
MLHLGTQKNSQSVAFQNKNRIVQKIAKSVAFQNKKQNSSNNSWVNQTTWTSSSQLNHKYLGISSNTTFCEKLKRKSFGPISLYNWNYDMRLRWRELTTHQSLQTLQHQSLKLWMWLVRKTIGPEYLHICHLFVNIMALWFRMSWQEWVLDLKLSSVVHQAVQSGQPHRSQILPKLCLQDLQQDQRGQTMWFKSWS